MGESKDTFIVSVWSIKGATGTSSLSLSFAIEVARKLPDKKILWFTTNPYFCCADRALALKNNKYEKSIDSLLEHIMDTNSKNLNMRIVNESINKIDTISNMTLLMESNIKDRDYISCNLNKFKKHIMPLLEEMYDVIICDISPQLESSVTRYMMQESDAVINIITQNSLVLDQYLKYKNELNTLAKTRVNVLNMVRDVLPDIKTIKNEYEKTILSIQYENDYVTACNTGNLIDYIDKKNTNASKEIGKITDIILDMFNILPPSPPKEENTKKRLLNFFIKKNNRAIRYPINEGR